MKRVVAVLGLVLIAVAVAMGVSDDSARNAVSPENPSAAPGASGSTPAASGSVSSRSQRFHRVDVHVHLSPDGVERLEGLMARYHFDHVVNLSGGHPLSSLRTQLAAAKSAPGKITVFVSFPYEQARRPGYGERMAQLIHMGHEMGARGVKIAKVLGLALPGPDGTLLPVDDPGLDPAFEMAGDLGMPVAIHSGDPRAFWDPVDEKNERYAELKAHPGWSLAGKDVPSFDEIGKQLERRIARHPKTKFISVHFGNCAEDLERVARMLRKYPNMYIDTAARIPEIGRHPPEKVRAFFIEFQDRILYGSDLGVSAEPEPLFLGSEGPEPATDADRELFFSATDRFFETADKNFAHPTPIQGDWTISGIDLPEEVLRKVYAENAVRLLKLDASSDPE